jgi:hypothetical protein
MRIVVDAIDFDASIIYMDHLTKQGILQI